MAEKVPQSSEEEVTYVVASYRIGELNFRPSVLIDGILTLERAWTVSEKMQRAL